jgi:hypothetical protein
VLIDMIDDHWVKVEPRRVGPRALWFFGEQTANGIPDQLSLAAVLPMRGC